MAIFSITNSSFECPKSVLEIAGAAPCELMISATILPGLSDYALLINDIDSGLIPIEQDGKYIYEVPILENTSYKFVVRTLCIGSMMNVFSTPLYYTAGQLPNETDVYAFFDTSSMILQDAVDASNALNEWYTMYQSENPDFEGELYILAYDIGNSNITERYLQYPSKIWEGTIPVKTDAGWDQINILPPDINTPNWIPPQNVLILAFVDEANPEYHTGLLSNGFTTNYLLSNDVTASTVFVDNSEFTSLTPPLTLVNVTVNTPWESNITFDTFTQDSNGVYFNINSTIGVKASGNLTTSVQATDGINTQTRVFGYTLLRDAGVLYLEPQPGEAYIDDYNEMITYIPNFSFMRGVLYPIPRLLAGEGGSLILQSLAAMKGRILTQQEINDTGTNVDVSLLLTENPYTTLEPLESYNWVGVYNKESPATEVFNSETFATELNDIIASNEKDCGGTVIIDFRASNNIITIDTEEIQISQLQIEQ